MPSRPACRERKKNGRPCRAPALRAGSACFWHAAETREAAAEARRLGGLRRRREGTIGGAYALEGFGTGADLQRVLELALADTLELENSVPRTRALTQLVSVGRPGSRRPPRGRRACGRWRTACGGRRPMRDRERRLRRVTTRMTVRQRVAAMLAAGPGTTAVYDDIGRGLTPAGWAAFRRDCARLDQLNVMACVYLARADGTIDVLRLLVGWLATIRLTAAMADQLEDALDYWSPRRGPGGAADRDLDGEVRTIAGVLRRAEEELRDAGAGDTLLRDGILHTHHLLRALEIEVAAFAADLAADPLDADLHAQADRCHAELADLIDLVTLDPPIALTEPSDADVAAIAARCRPEEGADDARW